jgi:hypothetical protein
MRKIFYETPRSGQQIANGFYALPPRLGAMNAFTDHPHSIGESYWQHMRVALAFAGAMLVGAAASLVHALFPFLCTRTGSGIVLRLHARVSQRR